MIQHDRVPQWIPMQRNQIPAYALPRFVSWRYISANHALNIPYTFYPTQSTPKMSLMNDISSRAPSASSSSSASAPFMAESHRQGRHNISSLNRCNLNQHNFHGGSNSNSFLEANYNQPAKVKRVTAPLNEAVRAMLCGGDSSQAMAVYGTSGSDHGVESDSTSLTDLSFLEEDENVGDCATLDCESHASEDTKLPVSKEQPFQILEGILLSGAKLEDSVLRNVRKALGMAGHTGKNHLRRFVMSSLRSEGFNAAVCKTRWQQSNGHPAGDYEFIDVVVEADSAEKSNGRRVVVDVDFRAQFEIARPTAEYGALVEALPTLWVGSVDKLRDVIKIMCDAAKRSLKAKGMHLPPWRKYRYAQAKWVGVYKRTTNPVRLRFSDVATRDAAFPSHRELRFEMAAVTVREGEEAEESIKYALQCCGGVVVPRSSRKQPARTPGLTAAMALAAA